MGPGSAEETRPARSQEFRARRYRWYPTPYAPAVARGDKSVDLLRIGLMIIALGWAILLGVGMFLATLAGALEGNLWGVAATGLITYVAIMLLVDKVRRRRHRS